MMPELPHEFLCAIAGSPGFDEAAFVASHRDETPVSIRLNPFKQAHLSFGLQQPVPWNSLGYYLDHRPSFTYDPLFQAGCYYVQEAGSMFIEQALKASANLDAPLRVLDLCAAPGGKSTLLASLLNSESVLVANEVIKPRADVLSQNISKWGVYNTVVTNNDPRDFSALPGTFDVIVVDAPCSGSGLFRKQEDAIAEWSTDNVSLCSQRQKRILADVLPALTEGGTLVYSTCSYSKEENEELADWLVQEQGLVSVQIPVDASWGIVESRSDATQAYGYRFYPNRTRSEGFFCAVFQKENSSSARHSGRSKKQQLEPASKKEKALLAPYIREREDQCLLRFREDLLLLNQAATDFVNAYPTQLYYRKAGVRLGSFVKDELLPHHDLALCIAVGEGIPRFEATEAQAIAFLKKEMFSIDAPKGWNLVSYHGHGLGWIKHLGNRLNNYLPNEYKILH